MGCRPACARCCCRLKICKLCKMRSPFLAPIPSPQSGAAALLARARAVTGDVGVLCVVRVAARAVHFRRIVSRAVGVRCVQPSVRCSRHRFQVAPVQARSVPAAVMQDVADWNRADCVLVDDSVAPPPTDRGVAVQQAMWPQPARVWAQLRHAVENEWLQLRQWLRHTVNRSTLCAGTP